MRTFRSLRHRNYRLYFIGQLVSLIGSWTQMTALMWLAYDLTKTASWPALLTAMQIGPSFLLAVWAGHLADRFSRRRLIAFTQSAFLACAIALLGLYAVGALNKWVMLAVMLIHGVIQSIDIPARLAFIPGLVAREDLANAVALNSLLFNAARAVGPALAGALLGTVGAGGCFLVNTLSYLAVLLALGLMQLPSNGGAVKEGNPKGGFHVLAGQPGMLTLVLLAGLAAIGGWPLLALLPSFAAQELGGEETAYGTLLSAVGVGALGAALTAATLGHDVRQKVLLAGGLILVCGALLGLAAAGSLAVATGCCAAFGYGMILFFATAQSAVQLGTADADRGKVMGIWAMMLSAGVPMGNLVFGPAADAVASVRPVIAVQAGILALAAAILMVRKVK
jgi:predicted MFS family arabinose efflux permease